MGTYNNLSTLLNWFLKNTILLCCQNMDWSFHKTGFPFMSKN